jgi:hypothetical protein
MSLKKKIFLILFAPVYLYSCGHRNSTSPSDVVEIYFDYLQIWEFERAYDILSDSMQYGIAKFSYRPESVYGEWWKTCCFIKDSDIPTGSKSKVLFALFDLSSWDKKDFVAELIDDKREWKIASVKEFDPKTDIEFVKLDNNPEILKNQADSLLRENEIKKASQIYMRLVGKYPFRTDFHAKLGYLLTLIAHEEKELWERGAFKYMPYAQSEYEIALQLQSNNITAHLAKGLNNYWTPGGYGDPQVAVENFEYVLKQDSTDYIANYYLKKLYKNLNIENKRTELNYYGKKNKVKQELLLIE